MKIIVKAKPNSREEEVKKIAENFYQVSVKEPPVAGLANQAILKALAKYFNVSLGKIKIISGHTSRQKVLEII